MAVTRAELHQAFRETVAMEFADIPLSEGEIEITFSDAFVKKMNRLIEKQKKSCWHFVNTAGKRAAIVVLAFASLFVTVLGNEEISASMLEWCIEIGEEYNLHFFEGATTKEIEYAYQLTMVPEGFEVVQEIDEVNCRIITYKNNAGEVLVFSQWTTEEFDIAFDNEREICSTDIINGNEVEVFVYEDMMGARWVEDGYFMLLTYVDCEDIEVIKAMVESVK